MTQLLLFLATYALHSTILALLAIALGSLVRNDAWREVIWRTALVGGIITAAYVTIQPNSSPLARWTIDAPVPLEEASGPRSSSAGAAGSVAANAGGTAAAVGDAPARAGAVQRAAAAVAGAWTGIALLLLAQLAAAQVRLRRKIANRQRLRSGPMWERMRDLAAASGHAPVRLSIVRFDGSPFVIWPAEICLPEWILELDAGQQSAALAHELAHVRRRDANWQLAGLLIERVFFFQPLNRLLRRRLETVAERLCDDDAVRQLPDPLDLARCLTAVAERMAATRIAAPAMIGRRDGLLGRVERIARGRTGMALPGRNVLLSGATTSLVGFALLAPALRATDAETPGTSAATGVGPSSMQTGARPSSISVAKVRRDEVVAACAAEWLRVRSIDRQGVAGLGRELAAMEPRSTFILLDGRLLSADQVRAWRTLDLREADALLSEVVVYKPRGEAAASVGLAERGVVCLYTKPGVELPPGLGTGR